MSLFSGLKNTTSLIFNFRIDQWLDLPYLKQTFIYLLNKAKNLFKIPKAEREETFKEAILRFELSDGEIALQAKQYISLTYIFLLISFLLFLYSLYILIVYENYLGFGISMALIIYGLSKAFYYHFWYFQIKEEKLGCTLKEWFKKGLLKQRLKP